MLVVLLEKIKGEMTMKQNLINDVVQAMLPYLNNAQTEKLQAVMQHELFSYDVVESESKGKDVLSGL